MTAETRRIVLALQSTAVGGMETHVIDLAAEYVRRGIEVLLIVPDPPAFDDVALRAGQVGAQIVRATTDARGGRRAQARGLATLGRTLRSFAPETVHIHTGGATGGLGLVALARCTTRGAVVVTEHDVPGTDAGRWQRFARRRMDRLAHAVVAVSRRNAGLRQQRLGMGSRHFAVVLNGVPLPTATSAERLYGRNATRLEHAIRADEVVVGSLVRLAQGKGVETLLDAFARMRSTGPPCRLLLVGDGPLRPGLEQLATSLGVGRDVIFTGHKRHPAAFLDAMDVFVLPVPAGSMSIALLEAMARGLPPIITFGGPEEAVIDGETGLRRPPGDVEALAEAITSLVSDECKRRTLGVAAEQHVCVNYSVSRVADDLLAVYAGARRGSVPARLRADAPPDPRPGEPVRGKARACSYEATDR